MNARCLFDTYIVVDWSAASSPKKGADSIWWYELRDGRCGSPRNPTTREAACKEIRAALLENVEERRRVLIGFDFPYGYPSGWAKALALSGTPWKATWEFLGHQICDSKDNAINRFQVAAGLNAKVGGGPFPFGGCPSSAECKNLRQVKAWKQAGDEFGEFRITERRVRGPQPAWKLFTSGSVGSQALLGIPRLLSLRFDQQLHSYSKVWPFETGFALPQLPIGQASIIHAEIYPSLVPIEPVHDEVKDCAQVRGLAEHFLRLDQEGSFGTLFAIPADLAPEQQRIEEEEGWMFRDFAKEVFALSIVRTKRRGVLEV